MELSSSLSRGRRHDAALARARRSSMCSARCVFLFLMLPLFIVFPISFSSASYLQFPPPGWSLRWYAAYVNDPVWLAATLRSLKIAACTTVLATMPRHAARVQPGARPISGPRMGRTRSARCR